MGRYPEPAVERAMKVQEVITRAASGQLTWWQAAEILGITDRHLRRLRDKWETEGYDGLFDRRRQQPSPKRVPLATVEQVLQLYRTRYADFNVQHFHEKLRVADRTLPIPVSLRQVPRDRPRAPRRDPQHYLWPAPAGPVHGGREAAIDRRRGLMDMPAPWTENPPSTGPWTPGPDRRAPTFPQALVSFNDDRTFHVPQKPDILTYHQHGKVLEKF